MTATTKATTTTSTATSTTTKPTTPTEATPTLGELDKLGIDLLPGFLEDGQEGTGGLGIVGGEEGDGRAGGTGATSTPDSMHIIFDIPGEVIVDDKLDIFHIYTNRNND